MSDNPQPPTHAGGVVYRAHSNRVEYLLVQSTGPLREWVLPKGHIEPGESTRDAAVREVYEEARVDAEIVGALDAVEYTLHGRSVRIQYFLMKALREHQEHATAIAEKNEKRERVWLPLDQARERLAHEANRALLLRAELSRRNS